MNYKRVQIGEITTLRQGFAINKNTKHHMSDEPTSLHLLRIGDMKDGTFSIFVKDTIPQHFIATNEDIIYTRTGQVGLVFRNQNGVVHNNCFTVSPIDDNELSRDFLYYVLQTKEFYDEANSKASGAAQPDLAHGSFKSIEIPLPPLETQRRIASILSAYDDLIENNQKQIKLLEEAAQRLYKEWFVDLRFPGWEETKIVDGVPEGWEKDNIANVCTRINAGGTPSRRNKTYWENAVINWYKTGELQDCWLIESEEKISQEGLENSSAKIFPKNAIVMAIYASPTLGRLGIITSDSASNQAALCLIANESIISWQWLYHKLYELRDEFNAIAKGAGQQNISAETVKKKEIVIAPKKIIDAFTFVVEPLFEMRLKLQLQNKKLTEARDRLLPKLMSGELEV